MIKLVVSSAFSALLQENPVLIEPVKKDQRANERESCAKFKGEFLHFNFSAKMERVSDRRKITGHLFTSDVSDRGHAHAPRIPGAFDHVASGVFPRVTGNYFNELRCAGYAAPTREGALGDLCTNRCEEASLAETSQPFAMSGNLAASANASCSFFSGLIGRFQNSPRTDSYRLPGFVCLVRIVLASHGKQSTMRGFSGVQKVFAKRARYV